MGKFFPCLSFKVLFQTEKQKLKIMLHNVTSQLHNTVYWLLLVTVSKLGSCLLRGSKPKIHNRLVSDPSC